jgi:hypothetical protein
MASLAGMPDYDELGVDPDAWRKFDASLRQALHALGADRTVPLPVLIALEGEPLKPIAPTAQPREEWVAEQERAFAETAAPVVRAVSEAGDYALHSAWIARTLGGRLPLDAIERAAARPEVRQIVLDKPYRAIPESKGRHL